MRPDHIHILLDVSPKMSPSKVMQVIEGKTSHHMLQDSRRLRRESWGRHLWAREYFVAATGTVTDQAVSQYIESEDVELEDEDFKITHLSASAVRSSGDFRRASISPHSGGGGPQGHQ
jgi:putative transposase